MVRDPKVDEGRSEGTMEEQRTGVLRVPRDSVFGGKATKSSLQYKVDYGGPYIVLQGLGYRVTMCP